ncbi:hypothetical protein ACFSGX_05735 [Sphingomonas arantia]|uniref:GyrI-like small molecule binding domain-containing protein n=1 Tax=Sphingomonas arantia TaxID=1460676 RepID=A0ABW4TXM1_9SPHN
MVDVPLVDANIFWTPVAYGGPDNQHLRGTLTVENRAEPDRTTRYFEHAVTLGGCAMWSLWTSQARILELFRYVTLMTVRDGLDPTYVHCQLAVIPEYREMMSEYLPVLRTEQGDG